MSEQQNQLTATTTQSQPTVEQHEEIRDWGEVKKIIAQREQLKSELSELRSMIEGLKAQPQPAPAQPAAPADDIAGVRAEIEALKAARLAETRAQRRQQIEQSVLGQASEQARETVRLMLAGLHHDGAIDLHAEDPAAEAQKAAARLRQNMPGLFAQPGSASPAVSGSHQLVPDIPLHEMTREQLALLSDDEFSKRRRAARTSGLVV